MLLKTLCIFGTRPEAIKMAPLLHELARHPQITSKLCITGQHQQMLNPVLELFKLTPDFNLNVMTEDQTLSSLSAKILTGLTDVFKQYKPDIVLVHGDTTTTIAAAISAYYHQIPIAHIEAGLRTGDINSPWPEEANRKLTSVLAAWHFAPTNNARLNLLHEGVAPAAIHVTGNTVIDALYMITRKIDNQPKLATQLATQFSYLSTTRKMILVTGHRRENFGKGFEQICQALVNLAHKFPNIDIVYPVHLNPHVQQPVMSLLSNTKNIFLIQPVDYVACIYLMKLAYIILTDSGGIQEEAPSLSTPVLVMRHKTERPEAIDSGAVKLVGTDVSSIVTHVTQLLTDAAVYQSMITDINPYGDGSSAKRITQILLNSFLDVSTTKVQQHEISNA